MNSDIKLDAEGDGWVTIESNVMKVKSSDFMLDNSSRRKDTEGFRRALVHNEDDGLTINFAGDYPGNVIIEGGASIRGPARIKGDGRIEGRAQIDGELILGGRLRLHRSTRPETRFPATEMSATSLSCRTRRSIPKPC
jgi:hypothetical protein